MRNAEKVKLERYKDNHSIDCLSPVTPRGHIQSPKWDDLFSKEVSKMDLLR